MYSFRYTTEIKQQIKENELERMMEAERIEEESKMLNKALIQVQKEEQQKELAKKELQAQMREEFKKANIEVENYKLLKQEEQRIADMRVCTYYHSRNFLLYLIRLTIVFL